MLLLRSCVLPVTERAAWWRDGSAKGAVSFFATRWTPAKHELRPCGPV